MDHREYVGGMFDEMSQWQFEYVTQLPEMKPTKRFLDLGCGSMRLGKHLIPWLNKGRYIGLDINQQAVDAGIQKECDAQQIAKKQPQFCITDTWDMSDIKPVDVVWAQAVFNHLNIETISACLNNLKGVLKPAGVFYCTYHEGTHTPLHDDTYTHKKQNVYKTAEQMTQLFADAGFTFKHTGHQTIRGQTIARATHL